MDVDDWAGIILLFLGFVLLGFVSVAEAVFSSIGQPHSKLVVEKGPARFSPLRRLLRRPRLTAAALVTARGVALVAIVISAVVTALHFYPLIWQTLAGTAVLTGLGVVLVEIVLKTLAASNMESTAHFTGRPIEMLVTLVTPTAMFFQSIADAFVPRRRPADVFSETEEKPESPILLAPQPGSENTEEEERKMIKGIFDLEQTPVSQIMVPRIDMAALEAKTPLSQAIDYIIDRGFSRVPVYEDTMDNVVGMIYVKDILSILRSGKFDRSLKEVANPAHFVPEYKKVGELLREFRQKNIHIAIVVDEYGGTEGLVSIEDLLEQIVGEISDEYDAEKPPVEMLGEDGAIVDSRFGIADLNELLGLSVEAGDFDTVGGLLLSRLGRIPQVGDTVQADGATFSVLKVAGKRATRVRVVKGRE